MFHQSPVFLLLFYLVFFVRHFAEFPPDITAYFYPFRELNGHIYDDKSYDTVTF